MWVGQVVLSAVVVSVVLQNITQSLSFFGSFFGQAKKNDNYKEVVMFTRLVFYFLQPIFDV